MGSLDELAEKIRKEDVARAVRIGACNTYHICVHNLVHEKSLEILKGAYKSAVFMLQAIAFLETGKYVKNKSELRLLLSREEQTVLKAGLANKTEGRSCAGRIYRAFFFADRLVISMAGRMRQW